MIGAKIKCDFCSFVGEMDNGVSNRSVSVPEGWVAIHPTVVVYGMRGLVRQDPRYEMKKVIKERVLKRVKTIHCCPGCLHDKNVFDMTLTLPPPTQAKTENYMRNDV